MRPGTGPMFLIFDRGNYFPGASLVVSFFLKEGVIPS